MSERAGYSRVYWTIVDDPKFVTIYDNDRHLSAWLRMLLIADQSHPASAHLPRNVRQSSVQALVDAGLVDLQPSHRYRIHGLDAERERRKALATSRGPSGHRPVTERVSTSRKSGPLDEDETRRGRDADNARADDDDPAITYWRLTGRFPTDKALAWIDDLTGRFGALAVIKALATAFIADPSTSTLMGRAQDRLRAEARELDRKEREAEEARLREKRAKPRVLEPWQEEFRRRIQEQYGDAA